MNGYKNGFVQQQSTITFEDVESCAAWIEERTKIRPVLGIVCGSGLGGLVEILKGHKDVMHYKDIPHFATSTVRGHAGKLVFGLLGDKSVVCMQGRFHGYEGYNMAKIAFPVRVMAKLGIKKLIVTNASGGLNPDYEVGDVMIMKDHINLPGLAGINPMVGVYDERFGPRFVPLSDAYNKPMRDLAKTVAEELGMNYVKEGVYVVQCGPCFETVTECRLMRLLGADVTGMSSVPEVIVGRQAGLDILGMSLVTNKCIIEYDSVITANHEEVLETGRMRAKDMERFVSLLVERMDMDTKYSQQY